MRKVSLIISDDFGGLKEVVKGLFPNTDHQLCLTHFKRNISRNMSKQDSKDFKERFGQLKVANSFDEAVNEFEQLILDYKDRYKSFMASVWTNRYEYLNFLKYPKQVRKYLYTTNVSENFN
ncbi:MAG: transposase, partial [Candidatus Omnitrophica bacterium]|nr:transposase [Candidatus Omnitrophota bacterium]